MRLSRLLLLVALLGLPRSLAANLDSALKTVRGVGPEGLGNPAASAAWKTLASASVTDLPRLLRAMDGANDYAANWLRSAAETVAQRAGRGVPVAALRSFVLDPSHNPRGRRLAYELIRGADPAAAAALLPKFVDDPSVELRRDAVQSLVDAVAKAPKAEALPTLRRALASARDVDQVEAVARRLGELGEPVDLREAFGWVTRWRVVGPFDNTGGAGFEKPFPPELQADPGGEFDGKSGRVKWQPLVTTNEYGLVDLNKPFGALKGVTGYALAEFVADRPGPAEIRLGSKNGWKVWFNGKLLFGRDEYHRGAEIDQYRMPVVLRKGPNQILVKLCQNEQTEDWTKEWEFQLRVTDSLGTPVRPAR